MRLTSKGQSPQVYETPYGPVRVERHVYQTSQGGKTDCPLEADARLILNATPRWAKVVSYKYASLGADSVVEDLRECNGRTVSNRYCKMLGDAVGTFAVGKETTWNYELPTFDRPAGDVHQNGDRGVHDEQRRVLELLIEGVAVSRTRVTIRFCKNGIERVAMELGHERDE